MQVRGSPAQQSSLTWTATLGCIADGLPTSYIKSTDGFAHGLLVVVMRPKASFSNMTNLFPTIDHMSTWVACEVVQQAAGMEGLQDSLQAWVLAVVLVPFVVAGRLWEAAGRAAKGPVVRRAGLLVLLSAVGQQHLPEAV